MFIEFVEAVRFLTVLPVPVSGKNKPFSVLARATFFFPLVGVLIAASSVLLFWLAQFFFPSSLAVLVLLIAPILLSGGLHLDGFADFCDGFSSARERPEILKIMKDSRVGALGAAGVTLILLIKFQLLQVLAPQKEGIFLLSLAASRWSQVVLSFFLPYAGLENGMGQLVAGKVGIRELTGATFFLLLAVLVLGKKGVIVFLALPVFLFLLGSFFLKKIGGLTGDLLGAASEMSEVFVLAAGVGLLGAQR